MFSLILCLNLLYGSKHCREHHGELTSSVSFSKDHHNGQELRVAQVLMDDGALTLHFFRHVPMTPLWIVAGLAIIMFLARRYAAEVYDIIIVKMTQRWYAAVLEDIGKSMCKSFATPPMDACVRSFKLVTDMVELAWSDNPL